MSESTPNMGSAPEDQRDQPEETLTQQRRFVWPPRPIRVEVPPAKILPVRSAPASLWGGSIDLADAPASDLAPSWWEQVEEDWLDVVAQPLARRSQLLGWRPDEPRAYCSRCGQDVGPFEADDTGCSACRGKRLPWARMVRLGAYLSPLDQFVREVKFTAFRRLGTDLGTLLGRALREAIDQRFEPPQRPRRVLLVPVPTSYRRRLWRGIDHSRTIAAAAARACGGTVWPALSRSHGPSQVSVTASRRAANVSGTMNPATFRWKYSAALAAVGFGQWGAWNAESTGTLMVVLDDVTTTGATLREACRALKVGFRAGGNSVPLLWTAAVASTPRDRRIRSSG